jgi:crotonobetainyl-CoA:carnitine CoA-transferase CaiB-like acyl-CoA transferase
MSVPGPLGHIKVLDLSRVMAGPWAGQLLADMGADVIKVERPGVGDDTRSWGPPFLPAPEGTPPRESGYYLSVNRGKRSLTINIDKPQGQEIVRALARRSDILLENFKVGTLPRYGLGYEDLKEINPRLIYCSVSGFGQTGRWSCAAGREPIEVRARQTRIRAGAAAARPAQRRGAARAWLVG